MPKPTKKPKEEERLGLVLAARKQRGLAFQAESLRRGKAAMELELSTLKSRPKLIGLVDMNKEKIKQKEKDIDDRSLRIKSREIEAASSREEYKKKWQAAYKKSSAKRAK